MKLKILFSLFTFLLIHFSYAQYVTNGTAVATSCNCYQITGNATFQSGSVWNSNRINLTQPFDFKFDVFLGCLDNNGADGMAFILQPISTSVGSNGGGLGFEGITPSVGVLLDTYQNGANNDPAFDHISININGNLNHNAANNLAGPIQILSGNDNAEDCAFHVLRITWDPATQLLSTYVDFILRVQTNVDLVGTIFNNNPLVYWGFTAATGGLFNEQKFCTRLNAQININSGADTVCHGQSVNFNANIDAFVPITQYYWDYGDGTTSTLQNPPSHIYANPGIYNVKFVMRGIDGCNSDTARKTITVGAIPQASFTANNACFGQNVVLQSTATVPSPSIVTEHFWVIDGVNQNNNVTIITNNNYTVGNHTVQYSVKTNFGCISNTATNSFTVFPKPLTPTFTVNDTCQSESTFFISNNTNPTVQANWLIDGVPTINNNAFSAVYAIGLHTIKHYLINSDGCSSDTAFGTFNVYATPTANFTINDTCFGKPITMTSLTTGGNITYQWFIDGALASTAQSYTTSALADGVHTVQHIVSNFGKCNDVNQTTFTVFKKPQITGLATTVCKGSPTVFTANLVNAPINAITYQWLFGDGTQLTGQTVSKSFSGVGLGTAKLLALSNTACNSDTVIVNYNIVEPIANAGNDTIVIETQPFNLNGTGNGISYSWQPASFLSNSMIPNPVGNLTNDQTFTLTITTTEGCTDTDDVFVKVFKGSKIYVPNAFTPNRDGINDILKPVYIGIKKIDYFTVFNRWGQKVFTTTDMNKGWDAFFQSKEQPIGTFIWILKATDLFGKEYNLKGIVTIIR